LKISTTISMKKFSSRAFDWWLHLEQPLKIQKLRSSPDLPSLPVGVSFYSEGGKKRSKMPSLKFTASVENPFA